MFFRNITLFVFSTVAARAIAALLREDSVGCTPLGDAMAFDRLKPVGPAESASRGWLPPQGVDTELYRRIGDAVWLQLGGEDRILPAAVVNRELGERIARIEKHEGRRLGGRARKRLKADVVAELLPRALVKPYRLNAYLDLARGFLAIDTTSRVAAEALVSQLRAAIGSFPALPLNAEASPRAVLTAWLRGEPLPAELTISDACELRDPVDGGGIVRCSQMELASDDVGRHLEAGMQCTRLALMYEDHVDFTFGDDLVLRKIRFLDGALEALESQEHDDRAAELDARFALMAGEFGRVFDVLAKAFVFSRPDDGRA